MLHPSWLWAVFTVIAATGQTFRNSTQLRLTERLGTTGATHIRFLYGLPFGLLMFVGVSVAYGNVLAPNVTSLLWTGMGAIIQFGATALMLAAMRTRSFVVTVAYTKTEPLLVAVFVVVFLGEHLTVTLASAILIATAGVFALSWPSKSGGEIFSWRPAVLGVGSGGMFALSSIGFRGGITSLGADVPFVQAATLTLVIALTVQTVLFTAYLALRNREQLRVVIGAWREALPAGFLGAFASEMWFLAFALESPARVRTLGLVEIVIAGLVSRRLFAQTPSLRDVIGMILVVIGIVLLFSG
jgi:drug/metabolite transporter (DMT)-like permease